MKKIKTSELSGKALDWAVAKAEGREPYIHVNSKGEPYLYFAKHGADILYSRSWAQGGPIIEREGIHLRSVRKEGHLLHNTWLAKPANGNTGQIERWNKNWFGDNNKPAMWYGHTPLIAAMRCYVASKLGDTVEIPEELYVLDNENR
jgi:hypothetical protein